MADILQLNPHDNMTVSECLHYCLRNADDLTDCIVIGYDADGELVVRSSHMSRKDALWAIMAAADHARGFGNG